MEQYIEDEIAVIEDAIRAEKQDRGNRIVKELARAKKAWEAKLAKLSGREKKDDLLTFEDLGIDWLFIDEAHLFKNLWRFTKMTRVAGLPNSNSERAFDMFVKTRYVMERHRGRAGVVFATGTPVSNSMAEMWVMQRYLQPKTLEANQVGIPLSMLFTFTGMATYKVSANLMSLGALDCRIVSRKLKGEKEIPVIDINSMELLSVFEGIEAVRVVVQQGRIFILPLSSEIAVRERLDRLKSKLESGEPIQIGSLSHGGGVLTHGRHSQGSRGLATGRTTPVTAIAAMATNCFLLMFSFFVSIFIFIPDWMACRHSGWSRRAPGQCPPPRDALRPVP